ncbi:MAG: hypothetical protein ABI613_07880 [Gemmatimonadota bacterium]
MTPRSMKWRLFVSCWIIYVVHFATDFVREHYLVVSIAQDATFRLDPYADLHVDLFWNPDSAPHQGAHHGANPGVSMLAAVPYALLLPAVNHVVNRNLAMRKQQPDTAVNYNDPRWRRVEFYKKVRERGLDVRFGLVAAITQVFFQAPVTALSVVVLFGLLLSLGLSRRLSLGLSVLYAFGTPVFFRTGYLNQNLGLGLLAFFGFVLIWNPGNRSRLSVRTRFLLAGLLGGLAFLYDYSGALAMGLLGLYALVRRRDDRTWGGSLVDSLWYGLGMLPGIFTLWWYQWASFGNFIRPPQAWMPPVEWVDIGYQGVGGFGADLFRMLLIDSRFGLFVTAPILVLALAAPFVVRKGRSFLPAREAWFCLLMTAVFIVFFSFVQYTRLQWVTGIRYLAPILPFLFLPAAAVFLRLPRAIGLGLALVSLVINWCIAMVRSQGTVFENVQRVFLEGPQLPWLTVFGKTASQYAPWLTSVSPTFILLLTAIIIYLIWKVEDPWASWDPAETGEGRIRPVI